MQGRERFFIGGAVAILLFAGSAGGTAVAARSLGRPSYLVFFALNMLLSAVVLLVPNFVPWVKMQVFLLLLRLGIRCRPPVQETDADLERRYSRGFWAWIRRRGAVWLLIAVALSPLGSAGCAATARFMRLSLRRTWRYVIIANVVTTLFWISLYLGDWALAIASAREMLAWLKRPL